MLLRIRSLFFVMSALIGASGAIAQSCDRANAAGVKVVLDGCGGYEPAGDFNVEYGTDVITVQRREDGKTHFWFWEAPSDDQMYTIGSRTLSIPMESIPRALAKCNTPATADRSGGCIAVYSVKCEPLWSVRVAMVAKTKPPLLTYERQGTTRVDACAPREPFPAGPGKVNLALGEKLVVNIDRPKCYIDLPRESFSGGRDELTLEQVTIKVNKPHDPAVITGSRNETSFVRLELQKKVKELRFSTKE